MAAGSLIEPGPPILRTEGSPPLLANMRGSLGYMGFARGRRQLSKMVSHAK